MVRYEFTIRADGATQQELARAHAAPMALFDHEAVRNARAGKVVTLATQRSLNVLTDIQAASVQINENLMRC